MMRRRAFRPERRPILITGASSGIGRHCALTLHRRPAWRVIASVRNEADVAGLAREGLDVVVMTMEDPASIERGFAEAMTMTGSRLDALFLNAGYGQFGAIEDLDWSLLEAQLATNTIGPVHLARQALPIMRRQAAGRIVFNGSVLGLCALPLRGAYCASKFALEALADTLRIELDHSGIDVITLEPGPIRSRFNEHAAAGLAPLIATHGGSRWANIHRRLAERLANDRVQRRFTLGPEAVMAALDHALHARRPRTHYPVTVPAHALTLLRRILPRRWLHAVLVQAGRQDLIEVG